jgi:hypothetical protein
VLKALAHAAYDVAVTSIRVQDEPIYASILPADAYTRSDHPMQ